MSSDPNPSGFSDQPNSFAPVASGRSARRSRTPTWRAAVVLGAGLMLIPVLSAVGLRQPPGDTPVTSKNPHPRPDEEALAWSLLATLGVTFGMVTACGWGIRRHQQRSGPDAALLDDLRHELAKEQDAARRSPFSSSSSSPPSSPLAKTPEPQAPWERPGDWWQRQDFHQD